MTFGFLLPTFALLSLKVPMTTWRVLRPPQSQTSRVSSTLSSGTRYILIRSLGIFGKVVVAYRPRPTTPPGRSSTSPRIPTTRPAGPPSLLNDFVTNCFDTTLAIKVVFVVPLPLTRGGGPGGRPGSPVTPGSARERWSRLTLVFCPWSLHLNFCKFSFFFPFYAFLFTFATERRPRERKGRN